MIRVSVELIPHGDEGRGSVLSQVTISNTGPTSAVEGVNEWGNRDYLVECGDESFYVEHRRGDGFETLVSKAFAGFEGRS